MEQILGPSEGTDERLLTDQLFEQLSEAIVLGTFAPGAKLSEPRLAAQYGVSRGPLREAIRRLEERKLVTRAPRQGVRVVVPTPSDALELFTIREVLEGLAARQAAEHATDAEINELRAMLQRHRGALSEPDALVYWQATANSDFHFMIARVGRNQHLFDLLCGEYYTLFRLYRMQHRIVPGRAQRALAEHERIVEAVADRDVELAELLMRRHIASARKGLISSQA
ncbi:MULTISPECIES: GntR family transcriptional regulator [unclassified Devosia]|uniref:GntR family transcriptional regulator n=1 Tax=unclassified Devosia TaxID=196773 RepID=UPI00145D4590|nr:MULTISPECIES: GntR family transcriptional regulator [unclassified Devosia]MBJ6988422.1 GntR family transcriptional regulator [Devosia sp. MC521]MBK1795494.1 GntR family transcriptional regulator [Devosia sp. WQ 349K1]QMW62467.1 GntR family transcriptional regulator [Devosia sp. MC521]